MYGNNYHYWQLRQNMSSWFSTRQINIILSYQHIWKNQIIWRMFQCVGQHRYLFSVSLLIMEAILTSDVVPLSECLLLKKNFQNTVVLPSRVRKVHWSALPEYSDRSLQSTSMNSQLLLNSNCTKFLHCRNCFFKLFNFSPCKRINQKWVPYASVKISKK